MEGNKTNKTNELNAKQFVSDMVNNVYNSLSTKYNLYNEKEFKEDLSENIENYLKSYTTKCLICSKAINFMKLNLHMVGHISNKSLIKSQTTKLKNMVNILLDN